MSAALLLSRLEGVRKCGSGWRANCPNPVHSKAHGALSIAEADDGRILLHCFACNDTAGILGALGLEVGELFPERIKDPTPEGRRKAREPFKRHGWAAALGVLAREATIVEIAAHEMVGGVNLPDIDHARLMLACDRIHDARRVLS